MKKRVIFIITRQGTEKEFCNYWMGEEEPISFDPPDTRQLTEPILIDEEKFLVLIFNGSHMPDDSQDVEEIFELLFSFSKKLELKLIECSEVGMIWHGFDPIPNISDLIPDSSSIIFNKRYSSSLGINFCEQIDSDFVANLDPKVYRSGTLDSFRDAIVIKEQKYRKREAFNSLWEYFDESEMAIKVTFLGYLASKKYEEALRFKDIIKKEIEEGVTIESFINESLKNVDDLDQRLVMIDTIKSNL